MAEAERNETAGAPAPEAEAAAAPPQAVPNGAAPPEPAPETESEAMEALRGERDEMRDRFMRALAEAENVRKRADRDRREAESYGGTRVLRDLLPVFDNLERAVSAVTEEQREAAGPLIEGVELTLRSFEDTLARHGVESIAPVVGDRFDPQRHEAMFEAMVPDTKAGDIIQVMTRGFMLHDRLLRPAQVGVSSTPAG
jgi:molecular chaperone GrpE